MQQITHMMTAQSPATALMMSSAAYVATPTPARLLEMVQWPELTALPSLVQSALTGIVKSPRFAATAPMADSQKMIMRPSSERIAHVLYAPWQVDAFSVTIAYTKMIHVKRLCRKGPY